MDIREALLHNPKNRRLQLRREPPEVIGEIQIDLDQYMIRYNELRTNQGRRCDGKTPMQTFLEGKALCERYVPRNDGREEIIFEKKNETVDFCGNQLVN